MGKGTILLVDDDEDVRFLLTDVLEDEGFKVIGCQDGIVASRVIMKGTNDLCLVLTDNEMPGGSSGMDVLRTAKHKDPEMPVIVMSGRFSDDPSEQGDFLRNGASATIAKPFKAPDVVALVEKWARRASDG